MRDQSSIDAIAAIVLKTLSEDFEAKVVEVRVSDSDEFESDDLLRIEVIFDGKPKDAGVFSKAVRHVRPKLSEIGENAFPVFSFTSENELRGKAVEPA